MHHILVIEDDRAIARGLADALQAEGYAVVVEHDGVRGFERARQPSVDLVLLDLVLPGKNGLDICRDLRRDGSVVPILMLTSKRDEIDRVIGLELGADDYMGKPFSVRELLARIRAILRRTLPGPSRLRTFDFGDVHVDFETQEVTRNGRPVRLTVREFHVLKYLIEREGKVVQRSAFLDEVWGYEAFPTTRTVDNYILSLRKKIEPAPGAPTHILTIHTAGYRFVARPDAAA
jgi:DNA-binding response OmpR family regulator